MDDLIEEGDLLVREVNSLFLRVFVSLLCLMSLANGVMMIVIPIRDHLPTSQLAELAGLGVCLLLLGFVFSQVAVKARVEINRRTRTMTTTTQRISFQTSREEVSLVGLDHVGTSYRTGGGLRQAQSYWYIDILMPDGRHLNVLKRPRDRSVTTPPPHVRSYATQIAEFLGTKHR